MDKSYLVKKSNYFIMNCSYDLSLEEQKLILTLSSMVQPDDEEFKPYNFKIADFIEMLGIENQSKYTETPKITKELMKKVFEIQEGNKLIQTAWLSSAIYEKGSGIVTLKFSPELKPYMLKLSSMFTQYKLANILSMKSKYSPRIYEILKCNEFKKQEYIEIEVEELRKLLKADSIYPLYADFKRYILQRTQKELRKLTDIAFDFEEIKTGRKVTLLRFYIHSNKKVAPKDEVCVDLQAGQSEEREDLSDDLQEVISICEGLITGLDAKKLLDAAKGDIRIIGEKYEMSKNTNADDIMSWMLAAIKGNWKPSKSRARRIGGIFNNYDGQRQYDVKKFEKMMRANQHYEDEE